jgi:hypothetical protein
MHIHTYTLDFSSIPISESIASTFPHATHPQQPQAELKDGHRLVVARSVDRDRIASHLPLVSLRGISLHIFQLAHLAIRLNRSQAASLSIVASN